MAALGLARCTIDPADTEEVLAERAALVAATRDAVPGLTVSAIPEARPTIWQGGRRV